MPTLPAELQLHRRLQCVLSRQETFGLSDSSSTSPLSPCRLAHAECLSRKAVFRDTSSLTWFWGELHWEPSHRLLSENSPLKGDKTLIGLWHREWGCFQSSWRTSLQSSILNSAGLQSHPSTASRPIKCCSLYHSTFVCYWSMRVDIGFAGSWALCALSRSCTDAPKIPTSRARN